MIIRRFSLSKTVNKLREGFFENGIRLLSSSNTNASTVIPQKEELMVAFPDVAKDMEEAIGKYDSKYATKWFSKALEYNVPVGRMIRGLTTFQTWKMLEGKTELSEEKLQLARYLSWCVKLNETAMGIFDDIMDGTELRRSKLCWHNVKGVGLMAINDALLMDCGTDYVLKKRLGHTHCYKGLVDLFKEMNFITWVGQSTEMEFSKRNVREFNMDAYNSFVVNKSKFLTYLPVAAAMHLHGIKDDVDFRQAETHMIDLGVFCQVQNDFDDCFKDPGKPMNVGNDIETGKCTWLAAKTMELGTEKQKQIMRECYGQKDPAKIAQVKELYEELALPELFVSYKKESYSRITKNIQKIPGNVPHEVLNWIIDIYYNYHYYRVKEEDKKK